MALKGYTKQLYVDDVLVACITNITTDITQPTNEVRHKGLRNIKGLTTDQIDEQSGTFQISGIFTDDTSNIVDFVDWAQRKLVKSVRISDGQNFGDRALFFDALCETDSETDTDLLKFDITLKSTGEITQGVITPPSLFTFYTNKVGTIFIQATGDNSAAGIFTDGFGNTLTMPYTRQAGDSEIIYMRGENAPNGLADFKTLTAANNSLYGDYDFSQWTSLENANLEGNNLDSATFVDGQFNTGTLNVINSFVQGAKFTQFITAFDTAMSTPRSSILDVGTIDDPLLLDPGDTTGTYAAIQSLTTKGWLISVVSNKLFTATIGQSGTITPNANLSAVGSLLYTLNGISVSNITFNGSAPSTFNVNQGDILECWYANPTNDLFGLDSVICNDCNIEYIYLDDLFNASTKTLEVKRNVFTISSINIIKSYLDQLISNGDNVDSAITVNINSLQVGNLYTDDDYNSEIVNYQHSDRLTSYVLRAEIDTNPPIGYEIEGNFIVDTNRNRDSLQVELINGSIKNEFLDYWNEQLICNNNPNLLTTKVYGQNVNRVDFYNTGITSADLSNSTLNNARLYFYNCNNLTSLIVGSGSIGALGVQIYFTSLVSLDFSSLTFNTNVFRVYNNNLLTSLIVGSGNFTGTFWTYNNNLSSIDIDNCILASQQTYLYDNNLTSILFNSASTLTAGLFAYNNNLNDQNWSNISLNLLNFRVQNNPNCNNIDVATGSNLGAIIKDAQTTINYI